jgi:DNA-binding response OmpR family regulator
MLAEREDKMARVLIVDDALMMRKMIRKMVESAGHIVVDEAVDGEQAIEMYQRHVPDVVTMDITMPGTDGIEALTRIIACDKDAKIIMVSALGQQYKVMEALENGAKSYILKPITAEKLIAVINQILGTTSKTSGSAQPIFECGEGRHQKSCDRIVGKEAVSEEEHPSLSLL